MGKTNFSCIKHTIVGFWRSSAKHISVKYMFEHFLNFRARQVIKLWIVTEEYFLSLITIGLCRVNWDSELLKNNECIRMRITCLIYLVLPKYYRNNFRYIIKYVYIAFFLLIKKQSIQVDFRSHNKNS